jgi:serine protease Do
VTAKSPAELAGLESDDVILRFNGVPIENDQHLISLVNLTEIGRQVELMVMRHGQMLNKQAQIGRRGDFVAAPMQNVGGGR